MFLHRIEDWDNAYANGANIARGERWPEAWVAPAAAFREGMLAEGRAALDIPYARGARNQFDLFLPKGKARGLVVFIHGGFWMRLDRSYWSHLAAGPVEHGFAVAMPSYTLCPQARIGAITAEIGLAIAEAAQRIEGPIRLAGHSAGGHLATRMLCADGPLPAAIAARLRHVVSISGLHDLRPLINTAMNKTLRLDMDEATRESPALLLPAADARLTCWAGAAERAEFLRQNRLLADMWKGLGAATAAVEEPDRHHFDICDGLTNPDHPLTRALLTA